MRTCRHRGEGGEVDGERLVVHRVVVRLLLAPHVLAPLGGEKRTGDFVGGKDGGRCAQFRAHVGDGGALGNGERLHAFADVFHDLADAALDRETAQDLKNDVLCRYPGAKLADKLDLHDLRIGDVVRAAAHRDRNVETARAHRQHAETAAGRRVAVRADQRLARHAEALEVHLVADAVAGAAEVDAVLFGDRTDEAVIVRIFKPVLQGIVVDVGDRTLGAHARNADGFKFDVCHCAGRVLRQRLVDFQPDLRALFELAVHNVCAQNLFGQCKSHVPKTSEKNVDAEIIA